MNEPPEVGSVWELRGRRREVVELDLQARRIGWRHPDRSVVFWCFVHSWYRWANDRGTAVRIK